MRRGRSGEQGRGSRRRLSAVVVVVVGVVPSGLGEHPHLCACTRTGHANASQRHDCANAAGSRATRACVQSLCSPHGRLRRERSPDGRAPAMTEGSEEGRTKSQASSSRGRDASSGSIYLPTSPTPPTTHSTRHSTATVSYCIVHLPLMRARLTRTLNKRGTGVEDQGETRPIVLRSRLRDESRRAMARSRSAQSLNQHNGARPWGGEKERMQRGGSVSVFCF